MSAYNALRNHTLTCSVCSRMGPFCPTGLELGAEFERENRHLDALTSECWEPPLIDYPTDEQMSMDYARWEASQKGKL